MNRKMVFVSVLGFTIVIVLTFPLLKLNRTNEWQSGSTEFCRGLEAYEKGERTTAEQIWKKALQKSATGDASTALWLGILMKDEGRFDEAENLLKQALVTSKIRFGADSLEAANAMRQLAEVYEGQGKLDAAEALLRGVIKICSKGQGQMKSLTMLAFRDLAQIYDLQQKPMLAKPTLTELLELCETVLGKSHPNTELIRRRLAVIAGTQ